MTSSWNWVWFGLGTQLKVRAYVKDKAVTCSLNSCLQSKKHIEIVLKRRRKSVLKMAGMPKLT